MNLIDGDRASQLYDAIGPAMEVSGGSAANTAVGISSFGGVQGLSVKFQKTFWAKFSPMTFQPQGLLSLLSMMRITPPRVRLFW